MKLQLDVDKRAMYNKIICAAEDELLKITGLRCTVSVVHTSPISEIDIKDLVCIEYGVSWSDVVSEKRDQEFAFARHAYVHLCYKFTLMQTEQIMEKLNRSRCTFNKSLGRAEALIFTKDSVFWPPYNRIYKFLQHKKNEYQTNQNAS